MAFNRLCLKNVQALMRADTPRRGKTIYENSDRSARILNCLCTISAAESLGMGCWLRCTTVLMAPWYCQSMGTWKTSGDVNICVSFLHKDLFSLLR